MIEKEKEPYQYAAALGNYGFCLIALGDFDRALTLHNEALALYAAQGKEAERATELSALGGLYFRIGDTQRALDILRMAIAAQERLGNGGVQAATLRVAGNAASALGQHETALEYLRKASQIDANPHSRGPHPRADRRGAARARRSAGRGKRARQGAANRAIRWCAPMRS